MCPKSNPIYSSIVLLLKASFERALRFLRNNLLVAAEIDEAYVDEDVIDLV